MFKRLYAELASILKELGVLIREIRKMDQNVQDLTAAWNTAKQEIEASRVLLQKIPGLIAAAATAPDVSAALKDLTSQIVSETAALTTDVNAASPATAPASTGTTTQDPPAADPTATGTTSTDDPPV